MNKTIKTLTMAALAAFTFGFAPSAQAEDVAQVTIGGVTTPYATITEAWTAAQAGTAEDHATLTLLTNVTVTAALSNKAVMTLDLNGYVLQQKTDGQNALQNTGTLTINDSRYDSPLFRQGRERQLVAGGK